MTLPHCFGSVGLTLCDRDPAFLVNAEPGTDLKINADPWLRFFSFILALSIS
jgi:hypothetical protein